MAKRSAGPTKRKVAAVRRNACPPGFVTRAMLCKDLGISASDARALAAQGILNADARNAGNYALYSRQTLDRLKLLQAQGKLWDPEVASPEPPASYSKEQGIRVFELLGSKTPGDRIVVGERLHPRVFLEIRDDYERAVGAIDFPTGMVARVNAIAASRDEPPVASSLDLLAFIEKLARPRMCPNCKHNPSPRLCGRCAPRRR